MIDVVFAMGTETVGMPSGLAVPVIKGSHWPATDPVVLTRPGLFTADPRYGMAYSETPPGYDDQLEPLEPGDDRDSADDAEQATAAPGERRNVRRPKL
jgi:hypothetical protein